MIAVGLKKHLNNKEKHNWSIYTFCNWNCRNCNLYIHTHIYILLYRLQNKQKLTLRAEYAWAHTTLYRLDWKSFVYAEGKPFTHFAQKHTHVRTHFYKWEIMWLYVLRFSFVLQNVLFKLNFEVEKWNFWWSFEVSFSFSVNELQFIYVFRIYGFRFSELVNFWLRTYYVYNEFLMPFKSAISCFFILIL